MRPFEKKLEGLTPTHLPKGAQIFAEGDPCQMVAFVLEGQVRVFKLSENGREMSLYRIAPGDSCILSISSLLSNLPLAAIAKVEEPIQALTLPSPLFAKLMKEEPAMQTFVFGLLSRRLSEVLSTVEEIAFHRVDERMVKYLCNLPRQGKEIETTHLKIAVEVGTSREVVSRILKDWESRGLVELGRGVIVVRDFHLLKNPFAR